MARCGVAAVLFGATTPFAARLAHDVSAPLLAGLLYLGAAMAVLPLFRGRDARFSGTRDAIKPLAVSVVFGGFMAPLVLTVGLARTTGATASLLLNFELPATALLAAMVFREHLGRRVVAGTALVMSAGAAVSWAGSPSFRVGALLIVGACLCWAVDNCVTANLDTVAPETITLAKGLVAGTSNLLIGLVVGGALPSFGVVVAALCLGTVGYGISITLWVSGARDLGAARGQLVFAAAPFVGVGIAWLALGEPVRVVQVIAIVLAAFGVTAVVGSSHEHSHHHHTATHTHEHDHDEHHRHVHDDAIGVGDSHAHLHDHVALAHAHPHVPDVHHRHDH